MTEKVRKITAGVGGSAVYEVVYDPDGGGSGTVTIRHAEGATEQPQEIALLGSVVGTVSETLAAVHREITKAGK